MQDPFVCIRDPTRIAEPKDESSNDCWYADLMSEPRRSAMVHDSGVLAELDLQLNLKLSDGRDRQTRGDSCAALQGEQLPPGQNTCSHGQRSPASGSFSLTGPLSIRIFAICMVRSSGLLSPSGERYINSSAGVSSAPFSVNDS